MRNLIFVLVSLVIGANQALAYQSMSITCVDDEGEEVWISVQFRGEDGDGGNRHQSWRERWTSDYFFQLNYQHGGLELDGIPYSWTAFQVDLNDMEFTYRTLWNSEIYSEQTGTCASITVEQV